jgi:hypothetical protein
VWPSNFVYRLQNEFREVIHQSIRTPNAQCFFFVHEQPNGPKKEKGKFWVGQAYLTKSLLSLQLYTGRRVPLAPGSRMLVAAAQLPLPASQPRRRDPPHPQKALAAILRSRFIACLRAKE